MDPIRHFILGAAGHVDHGKTALITALTGTNTDRLKEEQERGICIELGFAELDLGDGIMLGVVDMPGHERFVKQMVAGAGGVDLAFLLVAADEGVMPQTIEHLEILDTLGVRGGVVVIAKIDLVDEEMRELAMEEARDLVAGTFLEGRPVVPVSAHKRIGLEDLKAALRAEAEALAPRGADEAFRLPLDRVFSMPGAGAIVTGTAWSGEVRTGDQLVVEPTGAKVRIREVQVHGRHAEVGRAGQRLALALHGVKKEELQRGYQVLVPGSAVVTRRIDLRVNLFAHYRGSIKNRQRLHVHHAGREVLGRIVLLDHEELGGEQGPRSGLCQLHLEDAIVAKRGRPPGAALLLPGDVDRRWTVVDVNPRRHRRFDDDALERLDILEVGDPRDIFRQQLQAVGLAGLAQDDAGEFADDETAVRVGKRIYAKARLQELADTIDRYVQDYARRFPMRLGLPREEARRRASSAAPRPSGPPSARRWPRWPAGPSWVIGSPSGRRGRRLRRPWQPRSKRGRRFCAGTGRNGRVWLPSPRRPRGGRPARGSEGRGDPPLARGPWPCRPDRGNTTTMCIPCAGRDRGRGAAHLRGGRRAELRDFPRGERPHPQAGHTHAGVPGPGWIHGTRRRPPAARTLAGGQRNIMSEITPRETGTRRPTCAPRRQTRAVQVGSLTIGGDAPVRVQSMTHHETGDAEATLQQIRELATAGGDIVRVTVNDDAAAAALPRIVAEANVPIVADIHFDHKMALAAAAAGVAKLRINPGNIGSLDHVKEVARAAKDQGMPIRVGVNRGSLHRRYRDLRMIDPAGALVQCALDELEVLAAVGFDDVVVSLKSSEPWEMVEACRRFDEVCDVPQHLGVTEAGTLLAGTARSVAAMSVLLSEGIGDTVRISLADDPVEEVNAAFHMLQALGLREGYARVVACPTCGRVEVDVMSLAARVEELAKDLPADKIISVMGCIVNGPGEAKSADLGIAAGKSKVAIYRDGELHRNIEKEDLEKVLLEEIARLR